MSNEKRSTEPTDRLTRLCKTMTDALVADPEYARDVKCVVILDDEHRGGLQLHGYDEDSEAIVAVMMHLRAIFRANGQDLLLMPLHGEG